MFLHFHLFHTYFHHVHVHSFFYSFFIPFRSFSNHNWDGLLSQDGGPWVSNESWVFRCRKCSAFGYRWSFEDSKRLIFNSSHGTNYVHLHLADLTCLHCVSFPDKKETTRENSCPVWSTWHRCRSGEYSLVSRCEGGGSQLMSSWSI